MRALLPIKHKLIISWESFLVSVTLSEFTCKLRRSLLSTPALVQRPPLAQMWANSAAHLWKGWAGKLHHCHAVAGADQLGPGMHWHDYCVSTYRGRKFSDKLDIAASRCTGWYWSQKSLRLYCEFSGYIILILGFLWFVLYLVVVINDYLFERKHYSYLF